MKIIVSSFWLALLFAVTSCSSVANHATDEPFRSVYHHTPEANWMNDPNGMFYDDANGYWAMTNLVFPSGPYNHLDVQGGKATIYDIKY